MTIEFPARLIALADRVGKARNEAHRSGVNGDRGPRNIEIHAKGALGEVILDFHCAASDIDYDIPPLVETAPPYSDFDIEILGTKYDVKTLWKEDHFIRINRDAHHKHDLDYIVVVVDQETLTAEVSVVDHHDVANWELVEGKYDHPYYCRNLNFVALKEPAFA